MKTKKIVFTFLTHMFGLGSSISSFSVGVWICRSHIHWTCLVQSVC